MTSRTGFSHFQGIFVFPLLFVALAAPSFADVYNTTYLVQIDTTGLAATSGDLLFKFNYGGGSTGNTAWLQDFVSDGTLTSPLTTSGVESGTLPATVSMGVSSGSTTSTYLTGFNYGNEINFTLIASSNGPGSGSDDTLSLYLLASDGVTSLIDTRDPVDGTALLTLHVDGTMRGLPSAYQIFDPAALGTTMIFITPEPWTGSMLAIGLGALFFARRRR